MPAFYSGGRACRHAVQIPGRALPALREAPNRAPAGHLRRAPRAAPRRCVRGATRVVAPLWSRCISSGPPRAASGL